MIEVVRPLDGAAVESGPSLGQILENVRTYSPDNQFRLLNKRSLYAPHCCLPEQMDAADRDALIDFAATSDARTPLLVRIQAVEAAINNLSPDDSDLKNEIEQLMPLGTAAEVSWTLSDRVPDTGDSLGGSWYGYSDLVRTLMDRGGVSHDSVFPDDTNFNPEHLEWAAAGPFLATMYLGQINEQTTGRLAKLAPLAAELQEAFPDILGKQTAARTAAMIRSHGVSEYLDFGTDHAPEIDKLLQLPHGGRIAKQLRKLYLATGRLVGAFPLEYGDGVEKGVRELLASSLYAINAHYQNGARTNIRLPLNGEQDILPLSLRADEPLVLLQYLHKAIGLLPTLHNAPLAVTSLDYLDRDIFEPGATVVRATNEKAYAIYRFFKGFDGKKQSSVYIRPFGGYSYDPDMEYGRPREGVEPSISFVVDPTLRPGQLLEIGKHRRSGPDNRISIRLDREGAAADEGSRRDPASEQGVLSLDVGSIIGDDDWLGTKLGRFLAWGNVLRSRQAGEDTNLNHVRRYYDRNDGQAECFAGAAIRFSAELEARAEAVLSSRLGIRAGFACLLGRIAGPEQPKHLAEAFRDLRAFDY